MRLKDSAATLREAKGEGEKRVGGMGKRGRKEEEGRKIRKRRMDKERNPSLSDTVAFQIKHHLKPTCLWRQTLRQVYAGGAGTGPCEQGWAGASTACVHVDLKVCLHENPKPSHTVWVSWSQGPGSH